MKSVHYQVIMSDDIGSNQDYVISNAKTGLLPEEGDIHEPGIKMSIEQCNNLEQLFQCFCYAAEASDKENLHFLKYYERVLRGKEAPWKLVSVCLDHRFMWMTFQNEELFILHNEKSGSNEEFDSLPYYSECVSFELSEDIEISVKLRFEIDHPGKQNEIILVSFSQTGPTVITEVYGAREKSFLLPGIPVAFSNDEHRQLIHITEYYH